MRGWERCRKAMRIQRDEGFSLLEMVMTVAIVAIVVSFAVPSVADQLAHRAVRDARDTFVAKHGLTRSVAIREGRIGELHLDEEAGRAWIAIDTSSGGAGIMDTVGTIAHFSDQGVSVSSNRAVVCFDGRGLATEAGGCEQADIEVVFGRRRFADTVRVSNVGTLLP